MPAGGSSGSIPEWVFYLVFFVCAFLGILTKMFSDYLTIKKGGNMTDGMDEYQAQTTGLNVMSDLLVEFAAWGLLS